ncbi:hypothetical protein FS842_000060 [Serendipita sp. 407]|nr:hypothetical protein FS842_000060 [Serendipita sp. 407]
MDAFSLHHILLDDAALLHVSKNSRTLCRADNACTHKGYRALYPTLDKVLDRQHVCFRQRPSHRREDISFVISAFVEKGDRPDRWSPTALLLFSSASSPREHPCKRKAIYKEIEPQSFTWTHELKIQLECLQMLSLHFANDPGEQMTVLYEFGEFSDEGNALRDIRQMVSDKRQAEAGSEPTSQDLPKITSQPAISCSKNNNICTEIISSNKQDEENPLAEGKTSNAGNAEGFVGDPTYVLPSASKRRRLRSQFPTNLRDFPIPDWRARLDWGRHWSLYLRAKSCLTKIKNIIPEEVPPLELPHPLEDDSSSATCSSLRSTSSSLSDEPHVQPEGIENANSNISTNISAGSQVQILSSTPSPQCLVSSDKVIKHVYSDSVHSNSSISHSNRKYTPSSHPDSPDPPTVIPTYTSHAYENDPERVNWSIIEETKKFIASGNAMIVKVLSGHRGTKLQCSVVGWVDLDVQDE